MAKGKIHHWKHGWIPLDAYARQVVAKREGKKTFKLTDAPSVEEHVVKTVRRPRTVEEKRAALDKRRVARGDAPLLPIPPKRTRKPANWVPPAENKPTWKPSTAADAKKLIDAELAKDAALPKKPRRKISTDSELLKKNVADMTPEERVRVAEIVSGKDSPVARALRDQLAGKPDAPARERYRKVTTVDGVDFVTFKSSLYDPLGREHGEPREWTPEQMQITADAFNEVKAEFPSLEPVQFVATTPDSEALEDTMGITSWDGRRISLLPQAFNDEGRNAFAAYMGPHGGIAGQFTDDPEAFSRAVVVHELGHALQMQKTSAKRRGEIIARERVTPADFGMKLTTSRADGAPPPPTAPRWAVDTLDNQTQYGLGNEYEWFAEAFTEGWFNGEHATPEGKRVLALLHGEYGTGAPESRGTSFRMESLP